MDLHRAFVDGQKMSTDTAERIAWLRHVLSDPDAGHFYDEGNLVALKTELDRLTSECDVLAEEIPDDEIGRPRYSR